MSESTIKRLKRENAALAAEVAHLRERLAVRQDIELKLLSDILELQERVRELEGET